MIGKAGRSAMATLVKRASRYTVPVALPAGRRDAVTTCDALIAAVSGMPSQLVKTLTWDQGSEMAGHAAFTSRPLWTSTSRTRTRHGNAARTRTPTGCCASTSPRAPRSPTTRPTSTSSPASSTTDPGVSSATEPQQKSSPTSWPAQLLPPVETTDP